MCIHVIRLSTGVMAVASIQYRYIYLQGMVFQVVAVVATSFQWITQPGVLGKQFIMLLILLWVH